MATLAVPSHAPPLSTTSAQLLLSQAVCTLGTADWSAVARLLATSSHLLPGEREQVTAEVCERVFGELLQGEGLSLAQASLPNARPTRKLIRKLYSTTLHDVFSSLSYSFKQEKHLTTSITSIKSGASNASILASLSPITRARVVPASSVRPAPPPPPPPPAAEKEKERERRKSPRKSSPAVQKAAEEDEEEVRDSEGEDEQEVSETLRGKRRGEEIKREEGDEEQGEEEHDEAEEEGEGTRRSARKGKGAKGRGKGRPAAAAVAGGRKTRRGGGVEEDEEKEEGSGVEEEGERTPAVEDEEVEGEAGGEGEGEGSEDDTGRGKRNARKKTQPPVAARTTKRTSKRKTSEPFSPPPSGGSSDRQTKRVKTEGEVLAADGARFRKSITLLLSRLDDDPSAHMFKTAVKRSDAPAYQDAVKRPMWLAQVTSRVRKGVTRDATELMRDVALVCANAVQFNGREDNVGQEAAELWSKFEGMMEEYLSREQDE